MLQPVSSEYSCYKGVTVAMLFIDTATDVILLCTAMTVTCGCLASVHTLSLNPPEGM